MIEKDILEYAGKDLYRSGYVSAFVQVADSCNMGCDYCYVANKQRYVPDLRNLGSVVEKIEGLGLHNLFYEVSGGEILMRPDWEKVLGLFLSSGRQVYANSNATLIDLATARKLGELYRKHDERLFLNSSLDSHLPEIHNRTRGLFHETVRGLKLIKSEGARLRVNVVLNRFNIPFIEDTIRFLSNEITNESCVGVLRPVFPIEDGKRGLFITYEEILDVYARLTALSKKLGFQFYHSFDKDGKPSCTAGVNRFLVRVDGEVTPCYALRLDRDVFGNIYSEDLVDIIDRINNFNEGRSLRRLLCEHQGDVWGEPPIKLERMN